ncbi:MAG: hypothetical protein ACLURG_03255 [Gemmiger sp.]
MTNGGRAPAAFSDLSDFAQENFSGIAVIKAFVKELKELIAFRKLNKQNEEINVTYLVPPCSVLVTLLSSRSSVSFSATAAGLSGAGSSTPGSWWSISATLRPSSGPSWHLDAD